MDSFPVMSEEDIGALTFGNHFCFRLSLPIWLCVGIFQIKRARSYDEEVFYYESAPG